MTCRNARFSNSPRSRRTGVRPAAFFLFCLMLMSAPGALMAQPAIQLGTATGAAGDIVNIPLDFINDGTVFGFEVDVVFDAANLSVDTLDCVSTASVSNCMEIAPGMVRFSVANFAGPLTDAQYGVLSLQIDPAAPSQTFLLQLVGEMLTDGAGAPVSSNGSMGGAITVTADCVYTLSLGVFPIPPSGGTGSVDLVTGPGCSWTASASQPWVNIAPPNSGTGPVTISFDVAPNPLSAFRQADLEISGDGGSVATFMSIIQSGNAGITVGTAQAAVGDTVVIPLLFQNNGEIVGFQTDILFDSTKLGLVDFNCQDLGGSQTSCNDISPGTVRFVNSHPQQSVLADGQFGTLSLRVDNATVGEFVPLTIANDVFGDAAANPVPATGNNDGFIEVVPATGGGCQYDILPPPFVMLTAAGGSVSFELLTGASCTWSVSADQPWIVNVQPQSGTGTNTVNFDVLNNPSPTERAGQLQVFSDLNTPVADFTVFQEGDSGTVTCSYSVSPGAVNAGANGGTITLNIATDSGCEWTAESGVPWIAVPAGVVNSGSGSIAIQVAANTGAPRSGSVFVAGQLVTVAQSGGNVIGPAITSAAVLAAPGEPVSVPLDFQNNGDIVALQFDVQFDPTRVDLLGSQCFLGGLAGSCMAVTPDSVRFVFFDNSLAILQSGPLGSIELLVHPDLGPQSIPIIITNQVFGDAAGNEIPPNGTSNGSITVESGSTCLYQLSTVGAQFQSAGGTGSFDVTTGNDCSWLPLAPDPWIDTGTMLANDGSGTVNYSVAANDTQGPRSGVIFIADSIFLITQNGGGGVPAIIVGSANGFPGGVVNLPIELANDGSVTAFNMDLVLSGPGQIVDLECSSTDAPVVACDLIDPARARFLYAGGANTIASGPVGSLTVRLDDSAAVSTQVDVQITDEAFFDAAGNPVPPGGLVPGIVTVGSNGLSNQTFELREDTELSGTLLGGPNLAGQASLVLIQPPEHGVVDLFPDGGFVYRPEPNYHGTDQFIFGQVDSDGTISGQAIVDLNIDPVPDPLEDIYSFREGGQLARNVTDNDDLGSGLGSADLEIDAANGDLSFSSDGSFVYLAAGPGIDSFVYSLIDVNGDRGPRARVTITVLPDAAQTQVVDIQPGLDLDQQIDNAIQMANASSAAVRVRFPNGTFSYSGGAVGGSHAVPVLGTVIFQLQSGAGNAVIQGSGDGNRWLEVAGGAVSIEGLVIEDFSGNSDGGAIFVGSNSSLNVLNGVFRGNQSGATGGAIHAASGSQLRLDGTTFEDNTAVSGGGAVQLVSGSTLLVNNSVFLQNEGGAGGGALGLLDSSSLCNNASCALIVEVANSEFEGNQAGQGGALEIVINNGSDNDRIRIENSVFQDNQATAGCDAYIDDQRSPSSPGFIVFSASSFFGPCPGSRFAGVSGDFTVVDSTIVHDGTAFDVTGLVRLGGNILADSSLVDQTGKSVFADSSKASCEQLTGEFESLGFNVSTDASCQLAQSTDQPNTDPMLSRSGKDFSILGDSPIIDAAPAELVALLSGEDKELPCGYKDVNGLGRPQDGNDDGTYECDIGDIEAKNGPDVVGATSAAYFDPLRPGEGVFVEVLDGGLIFTAMFTYTTDGSGPAWMVGVGHAAENSMVIDEMLLPTGGVFGDAFDPDSIVRTVVGGMSMVFTDCTATGKPGRMAFQASSGSPFRDLLVQANRLSSIIGCNEPTPAAKSGLSGSFFDPARNGEGIFVQWLDDGRVVVIWYTYDDEGKQFWTISGEATVEGNSVTASMLYPETVTSFGQGFDPEEIELGEWGTITLEYSGCDSMVFSYDSPLPGFGSGQLNYQRLTQLAGTSCQIE